MRRSYMLKDRLCQNLTYSCNIYLFLFSVPRYHYTNPKPIDGRRRRSPGRYDLEYLVEIFGETTHLLLEKNRNFIAPGKDPKLLVVKYLPITFRKTDLDKQLDPDQTPQNAASD